MQELTDTEAAIFTVAQNNADISLRDIARLAKVKHHTARYALDKLLKERRLQLFPLIRFSRIGISTYILTLGIRGDAQVDKIMHFLRGVEGCSWTALYSGALAVEAWILASSPSQLQERIDLIVMGLMGSVYVRDMTLMTGYRFYGRRYFCSSLLPIEPLESELPGQVRFEQNDHLALQVLQTQCKSGREVRHGLSVLPDSTFRYRLARLRKEGVLGCIRLTVAQALRTREMIGIYLSDVKSLKTLDVKLDSWARKTPELVSICSGLGKFERKISVEVKKDLDARAVLDGLLACCGKHIGSIEVRILMDIGSHAGYPFQRFPLDMKGIPK